MKVILKLLFAVVIVLGLTLGLGGCKKAGEVEKAPAKEEAAPAAGGYGEKAPAKEEAAPAGGYGEKAAPTGGYGQ